MTSPLISIIIPAYDEAHTIADIVARVRAAPVTLRREIVVVDDASRDDTVATVEKLVAENRGDLRLVRHAVNRGERSSPALGPRGSPGRHHHRPGCRPRVRSP
jgi:glycosyltransferase involved in cell wall biosynthesis